MLRIGSPALAHASLWALQLPVASSGVSHRGISLLARICTAGEEGSLSAQASQLAAQRDVAALPPDPQAAAMAASHGAAPGVAGGDAHMQDAPQERVPGGLEGGRTVVARHCGCGMP